MPSDGGQAAKGLSDAERRELKEGLIAAVVGVGVDDDASSLLIQQLSTNPAALDPLIRVRLQQDLKEIFQRLRKTVVIVTHDISEAAYFGDHISVMRDCRVLQTGDRVRVNGTSGVVEVLARCGESR